MLRFTIAIFVLIVTGKSSFSQKVKYISNYYVRYDEKKAENVFAIKSDTVSFESKAESKDGENYSINGKAFFKCPKDSFVFLEVYADRYLLLSFYPASEGHLSLGPGFRNIRLLMFVSIADPSKKWFFDLAGVFNSESIKDFDPLKGELLLQRKIKAKNKTT